jgi:Ca-activated chloride channel family protein
VTRYSPTLLQSAAEAGGGTFIPAEATDKAARIKSALSKLRTRARSTQTGDNLTPRYQWFLLPAVLLLWLDTILGGRRGTRRRRAAAAETALAALLVAVLGLSGCRPPREAADASAAFAAKDYPRAARGFAQVIAGGDRTPGALYNYGTALLAADTSADSTRVAADLLEKAADKTDAETQYRARFNAGYAYLRLGLAAKGDSASEPLKKALAEYKLILMARPMDPDSKWNYELALRKEKSGGGGGGGGQSNASEAPAENQPKPQPTLAQRQAEQLLGSAEREERDVQSKKQKSNRPEPPPGGKDW